MIFQSLKMAWKSILSNKTRAFLTMLGIIIGVMALVVLVSLVTSATSSVEEQIQSMGNDMLSVSVRDDGGRPLKLSDLDGFAENESIALIAPVAQSSGTVKNGSESVSVSVTGTNNAYFAIEDYELASGRFIMKPDLDNNSYVVVLSNEAAVEFYGEAGATAAVGSEMTMDGIKYLIIGVLAEDDSLMSGFMDNYSVYLPITVAQRLSSSSSGMDSGGASSDITSFYATAKDSESIDSAEAWLNTSLLSHFGGDEDAFFLQNMDTLSDTMSEVTNTFSLLLGGIAAISLLVGGIGIMNVMLVSVTERTREIGIRKAIGARRRSIMSQFLIEALVICLIGCAIGIGVSGLVLWIINALGVGSGLLGEGSTTTFTFSGGVVLVSVLFSTLIGIVFGLYPAGKAAKMRPIEALRYE
jgi:putative ABC transport system permease protein